MTDYRWPIKGTPTITAGWYYPNGGLHRAIDVRCPEGTEVRAMRAGTVVWRQLWDGVTKTGDMSYGNAIKLRHNDGTYELMAHFSKLAAGTAIGAYICAGQVVGYSGNTGNSTGAHLHIEIRDRTNGREHPLNYLMTPYEYSSDAVKENIGPFRSPNDATIGEPQKFDTFKLDIGPVSAGDLSSITKLCDALGNIKYTITTI